MKVAERFRRLPPGLRVALVAGCLLILLFLAVATARDRLSRWFFSDRSAGLIEAKNQAERRAAEAESRVSAIGAQLVTTEQRLGEMKARVDAAEESLRVARADSSRVRQNYEQIRNRPFDLSVPAPDAAEFCARAADLGYPCGRAPVR